MEPDSLQTEVILTHPRESLGKVQLDWTPQPGNYLDFEGKTYAVLERRHKYQLKAGRYRLHNIAIYVQSAKRPSEKSLVGGRWVIGDATCSLQCSFRTHSLCSQPRWPLRILPLL